MVDTARFRTSRIVAIMFAVLFLAFFYISFQVAVSPRGYRVEPNNWQDIVAGTAQMVRRGRDYIWVVRYAAWEAEQFNVLTDFVVSGGDSCHPASHQACEFLGNAGGSIVIIRYVDQKPATLARDVPWFGGFVDPATGALHDRFGRLYKSIEDEPMLTATLVRLAVFMDE